MAFELTLAGWVLLLAGGALLAVTLVAGLRFRPGTALVGGSVFGVLTFATRLVQGRRALAASRPPIGSRRSEREVATRTLLLAGVAVGLIVVIAVSGADWSMPGGITLGGGLASLASGWSLRRLQRTRGVELLRGSPWASDLCVGPPRD